MMSSDEMSALQVAIKQMDNIIAGCQDFDSDIGQETPVSKTKRQLVAELRAAIEDDDRRTGSGSSSMATDDNANFFDDDDLQVVMDWLNGRQKTGRRDNDMNAFDSDDLHEKLQFLEVDRQNLVLQVGVLNEQVKSQAHKIGQLEALLSTTKKQLDTTDELFQQAILTRSSLEHAKLDLMADLSAADQKRLLAEERSRQQDKEVSLMKTMLLEKETEVSTLRLTLAKLARATGYTLNDYELAILRGKNLDPTARPKPITEKPPLPARPVAVSQFYSPDRSEATSPPRRDSSSNSDKVLASSLLSSPSFGRQSPSLIRGRSSSPSMGRSTSEEHLKSLRINPSQVNYQTLPHPHHHNHASYALQQIQNQLKQHEQKQRVASSSSEQLLQSSGSMDNFRPTLTSSPFPPRSASASNNRFHSVQQHQQSGAVSFAQEDQIVSMSSRSELPKSSLSLPYGNQTTFGESKVKGLARFFSKMKKSNSSSKNFAEGQFVRGGFRSTAGPRLTSSTIERKAIRTNLPFASWDTNLVAEWLSTIGLAMYSLELKRWCKNGEHLMRATAADVEKQLGIKNPLHRKKLRLAVAAVTGGAEDELLRAAGLLDYLWVARWLDDIGLPQYKDVFIDARVDGRVLHYLTNEDLFYLKITSQLHHASIRTGIQFDQTCLKRRAAPDEANITEWMPEEVSLWTCHRVMEWLRAIDLVEYAPNLRGSGVHGGLVVHEVSFNDDLLATLLNIPIGKTLLRRHVKAQFKKIIGNELAKEKRDFECQPGHVPMLPSAKVKAYRRGQFSFIKRRKSDVDYEDYVCSMPERVRPANRPAVIGHQKPTATEIAEQPNNESLTIQNQHFDETIDGEKGTEL